MTSDSNAAGWVKLTLLWIASFLDALFSSATLSVVCTLAVLALTVLQIAVTYRKYKRDSPHTDWDGL